MSIEGNQVAECSIRGSGSRDMQTSAKTERHMTKLELIDEMPPAFMDVKEIMKKTRSKRSAEEKKAIKDFVESVKFFRDAIRAGSLSRDTMDDICANMRMKVCEKNSIVFKQGDPGDAFYIVLDGIVHVLVNPEGAFAKSEDQIYAEECVKDFEQHQLIENNVDNKQKNVDTKNHVEDAKHSKVTQIKKAESVSKVHTKEFKSRKRDWMRRKSNVDIEEEVKSLYGAVRAAILQDGECFGDLALLNDSPRSASIVTKSEKCYLLFITRDAYKKAIITFQREIMSKRLNFLKRVHAFDNWADSDLQSIANLLVETSHQPGEVLCKEGDYVQDLILVQKGEARILKKIPIASMHFYSTHMTETNHPHLFHGNEQKKAKMRKHRHCFVEVGHVQAYDIYGHLSLMPKGSKEQKVHLEKFFADAEDDHGNPGDAHAHNHQSSLVATTSMKVYRLSRHDFGRRLSQFMVSLYPLIKYERTEDEIVAQHLETEEWELYKRALMNDVFRNSAKSKRIDTHRKIVGKHYQPPPPRKLPQPPRVTRGHYHDEMLEYLEKRKNVRIQRTSNKVRREALKLLKSPLRKRRLHGGSSDHFQQTNVSDFDSHLESRDQYWNKKKHASTRHGDVHHHDPHALAWRIDQWDQPHPPIDVMYRRLMKGYERRSLINHSIDRLRKVVRVSGEKRWRLGIRKKRAPKLKVAVKSMQTMLLSTFSHNKDVVSEAFREV